MTPAARSKALAEFAATTINEVARQNKAALGIEPRKTVYVDGRKDATLTSVKPEGRIVAEFELFDDVLSWIGNQLEIHSPVLTGRYRKSHILYADGSEIDAQAKRISIANEYAFVNIMPYARKIETGLSSQAPDGVYQSVAALARRRFGNIARISFSYRTAIGGSIIGGHKGNRSSLRNPAIIVTTGVR